MLEAELSQHAHKYETLCQCPACKAAIQAAALNQIRPYYVTGVMGQVHHTFHNKVRQNVSDILVALGRGIDEVQRKDPNGHMSV